METAQTETIPLKTSVVSNDSLEPRAKPVEGSIVLLVLVANTTPPPQNMLSILSILPPGSSDHRVETEVCTEG